MQSNLRDRGQFPLRTPLGSIGIGGSLAAPPLPHHRAYGSVHGGSVDYAAGAPAREARRRVLRLVVLRTRSLNRTMACGAMRRRGAAPPVKLNPRNLRCDGGATALLALLIRSFSRRSRKRSTLAISRSPARKLHT